VVNHFARLGLSPRPWIDAESLQQIFLARSAELHPDKASPANKQAAEQQFTELNESFNILRNSRARLLHLLELSGFPKQEHVQSVPPDAVAYFAEVAALNKAAETLIKEKAAASSPMLKVQLMAKGLDQIDAMQNLQARVRETVGRIEEQIQSLDRSWTSPPSAASLKQLSEHAATLGFLDRWHSQLHEKISSLTF